MTLLSAQTFLTHELQRSLARLRCCGPGHPQHRKLSRRVRQLRRRLARMQA